MVQYGNKIINGQKSLKTNWENFSFVVFMRGYYILITMFVSLWDLHIQGRSFAQAFPRIACSGLSNCSCLFCFVLGCRMHNRSQANCRQNDTKLRAWELKEISAVLWNWQTHVLCLWRPTRRNPRRRAQFGSQMPSAKIESLQGVKLQIKISRDNFIVFCWEGEEFWRLQRGAVRKCWFQRLSVFSVFLQVQKNSCYVSSSTQRPGRQKRHKALIL